MKTTTTRRRTPDGRDLCIESGGDTDGRPVLVHGGTPNCRHLANQWLEDAERRAIHLMSYDRPGYGGSTALPGRSIADCANDVGTIAEAFGIDRLAVWGYSWGGPYALACAALMPDLVYAVATLLSDAPYDAPGLDYFRGMGQDWIEEIKLSLDDPEAARRKTGENRDWYLQVTPETLVEGWASLVPPVDIAALSSGLASFLVTLFKCWRPRCLHMSRPRFVCTARQASVNMAVLSRSD